MFHPFESYYCHYYFSTFYPQETWCCCCFLFLSLFFFLLTSSSLELLLSSLFLNVSSTLELPLSSLCSNISCPKLLIVITIKNIQESAPLTDEKVMYETIWDTRAFNDKSLWPTDGSQPFVWSMSDATGFGSHADYVFGWKGDALQRAMDSSCYVNCPTLKSQAMSDMNQCTKARQVDEDIDSCEFSLSPLIPGPWRSTLNIDGYGLHLSLSPLMNRAN
jgi:hypothetical protein